MFHPIMFIIITLLVDGSQRVYTYVRIGTTWRINMFFFFNSIVQSLSSLSYVSIVPSFPQTNDVQYKYQIYEVLLQQYYYK